MKDNKKKLLKFCMIVLSTVVFVFLIDSHLTNKAEAASYSASQTKKSSFYIKQIPMSYKEQEYLYNLCVKRGLDYKEMLAFIKSESSFNKKAKGGNNYGYFQINKLHHANLAKKLKVRNAPFDPYVNMNWGTYMISDLYTKYKKKGLKGTNLKNAVLSAYNKGEGGYARTGKAVSYIKKHNKNLAYIRSLAKR